MLPRINHRHFGLARMAICVVIISLRSAIVIAQVKPHPFLESDGTLVTKQLGDFGESFVDAGLLARGFQVIDGNVDGKGIDRIAFKRGSNGDLTDVRFVEVKTRQAIPDFDLAITKNHGPQLSESWTEYNLGRIAAAHPDAQVRLLASEILEQTKLHPTLVRRELHGIAVDPDRYVILSVDSSGRVEGIAAEGRLTSLLEMLAKRGISEQTRTAAARHLAQFDQLQTALRTTATMPPRIADLTTKGIEGLSAKSEVAIMSDGAMLRTAIIVQDANVAKNWGIRLASQPGVLVAGLTFAVDETLTGWSYYNGKISTADFHMETAENGFKASAVGVATQLVYILAPTPSGLVLIGVGLVVYVAADYAIKDYEDDFVPKAPTASELAGLIPQVSINALLLDDVATGRARLRDVRGVSR